MFSSIRTGSQKFQKPGQKKFYRGYLAEGRAQRYTLMKFKRATDAALYAMEVAERLERLREAVVSDQ